MPIPVSLQLWSVREDLEKDFAATVKQVAAAGYQAVELAGYGSTDAVRAQQALIRAGLQVSGIHVDRDRLRKELNKVVDEAKILRSPFIICPSWPKEEMMTADSCQRTGEELNRIGDRLRTAGIRFGFHNHDAELTPVEKRPALEWILDAAEPRNLFAEIDVYWVKAAGRDPAALIRRLGSRAPLIHLKDETELGSGPVDFPSVFEAIDSIGAAEWMVIEQEKYNHEPIEAARLNLAQLRKWKRA